MRSSLVISLAAIFVGLPTLRAEFVNGVNVIVNDAVITYQDVQLALAPLAEVLVSQYRNQRQVLEQKLQETRTKQIEDLVEQQVILDHFKTAGYSIPETSLDDYIKERALAQFGDRVTLTKTLQAQGRTYESFRKKKRDELIRDLMTRQNVSSEKVLISPHKIEVYYHDHENEFQLADQIRLRLIVLNKAPGAETRTRQMADELHAKIKAGASVAEMASVYSDSYRAESGDRGWIDRKYFKKEISDVAFALKAAEVSDVVDLPEACYVMVVEEARQAHVRPLSEVREEIEAKLKTMERVRLHQKWIGRLKAKSFVQYYPL